MNAATRLDRIAGVFPISVGIVLLFTGLVKLLAAFDGQEPVLVFDPVFGVRLKYVFMIVGALEVALALKCFGKDNKITKSYYIAALSTLFVLYRLSLLWIGAPSVCNCLGDLIERLHLSPIQADRAMKIILGYMLLGSFGYLGSLYFLKGARIHRLSS